MQVKSGRGGIALGFVLSIALGWPMAASAAPRMVIAEEFTALS